MNNLNEKTTYCFIVVNTKGMVSGREFYMVDYHRSNMKNSLLGRNTKRKGRNINMELEVDCMSGD